MKMKFLNPFSPRLYSPEPDPGGGGGTPPGDPPGGGGGTPPGDPPVSILNPDFSFAEGYQEKIGEHAAGLTFKNLPDVFKSVKEGTATISRLNAEKAAIAKELETLKGGKPPEIPADAASYLKAIKLPEKMPDGVEVPQAMLDAAAKFAAENKIPPDMTSKFIEFQVAQAATEFKTQADQEFAAISKAKAEISSAVGPQNYDMTIENAKAAHDLLGLTLHPNDLIQNPTLVLSLSKLHTRLEPGTLRAIGVGKEGQSAEGKLQQANDILTNKDNPHHAAFYDNSHPNHKAAMDHYNRLILESGGDSRG